MTCFAVVEFPVGRYVLEARFWPTSMEPTIHELGLAPSSQGRFVIPILPGDGLERVLEYCPQHSP
jgi:hypothetical protein